jgi:predicted transcriptional regulator
MMPGAAGRSGACQVCVTIYGMAVTQKTTVYLDAADYRRLKTIARASGRTPAELVREAVAQYAAREAPRRRPRSLGLGQSRRGDIGERAEDLLAGLGNRR